MFISRVTTVGRPCGGLGSAGGLERTQVLLALLLSFFVPLVASADVLTLREAIKLSLKNHPQMKAEKYRTLSKEENVTKAQSSYYPKLSAMGVVSEGFPGSTGALGVIGLMGSPYRKGPAAGVVLEQDLWDFGRTSGEVSVAEGELNVAKTQANISGYEIGSSTVDIFYICARDKSLKDIYADLGKEARVVEKEVNRFVSTGQRSIVEKYLSESQTEEVLTAAADYEKRYGVDEVNLSSFLGVKALCPVLSEQLFHEVNGVKSLGLEASPFVARAKANVGLSESRVKRAKADYWPKLVGMASAGILTDTQFASIPNENYSVGAGLIIPLFEGFKTKSDVASTEAEKIQREHEVDAVKKNLEETNLFLDRNIQSAMVRREHLDHEAKIAEKAFRIAKRRYLSQQGSLVDLREALRNLVRTEADLTEAQSDFLTQSAKKLLLNGSFLSER